MARGGSDGEEEGKRKIEERLWRKEKDEGPKTKSGASTFLPTLLTGYISDSSTSTSSTTRPKRKKGPPEKKQRKNRMGQQARRALWAKKYGQNAAHLKQEAQRKEEREGGKEKKKKKEEGQTEGNLHPSWEAARKAREGEMVIVQEALKGGGGRRKVVFD
ncbi:BUD22-domain-containing protein [Tuber magnatum]|uniref:BUD22-domain-containing protein n=1 Tax=Tuber magnatum TaxID=42249 RepID=A0A317T4P8_9PEZI|nr:BUD22-domain-containing protein [Tuber magnatum]